MVHNKRRETMKKEDLNWFQRFRLKHLGYVTGFKIDDYNACIIDCPKHGLRKEVIYEQHGEPWAQCSQCFSDIEKATDSLVRINNYQEISNWKKTFQRLLEATPPYKKRIAVFPRWDKALSRSRIPYS